jgi:hypothetical protein
MIIARWLTSEIFVSIFNLIIKNRKGNDEARYNSLRRLESDCSSPDRLLYLLLKDRNVFKERFNEVKGKGGTR